MNRIFNTFYINTSNKKIDWGDLNLIVIYHDVGGSHSSCVAAALHTSKLPMNRIPDKNELLALPTFDKITKAEHGRLIYIGDDEFGAKVYTLCRQYKENLVIPAISDMYKIMNGSIEGFFLANTSPTVNTLMKIGGFSSRKLGWASFGRPIVTKGTLDAYPEIINLVKTTKDYIKRALDSNTK